MKKKKQVDKVGKKQVFFITLEPYKQECIVVVNGQFEDALKMYKKHTNNERVVALLKEVEENHEDYHEELPKHQARLYTELPLGYVMMINHQDSWVQTTGFVVHEALHLTHYVLRRAGIELTEESEEAYTYLQEKIVSDILNKIF